VETLVFILVGVSGNTGIYFGSNFFLAISWREQIKFQQDNDEVCFVLWQHA
jgi:hypothetical protein